MRMRKKKNLDTRCERCSDNLLVLRSPELNSDIACESPEYFDYTELFGNDNPVELEIGCGKGQFICELAKRNPNINYIAVERCRNVIVAAAEKAQNEGLTNIKFFSVPAEYLPRYLHPHSIGRIYLNFSCPFPKSRFKNRRLTHQRFLNKYKLLMADGAQIHQKTDNMQLFEFSIESFSNNGFALKNISLDLHNSGFEGNIVTEYENKFASKGFPIYRLEAFLPDRSDT